MDFGLPSILFYSEKNRYTIAFAHQHHDLVNSLCSNDATTALDIFFSNSNKIKLCGSKVILAFGIIFFLYHN